MIIRNNLITTTDLHTVVISRILMDNAIKVLALDLGNKATDDR